MEDLRRNIAGASRSDLDAAGSDIPASDDGPLPPEPDALYVASHERRHTQDGDTE
jgi:hypothetical protein